MPLREPFFESFESTHDLLIDRTFDLRARVLKVLILEPRHLTVYSVLTGLPQQSAEICAAVTVAYSCPGKFSNFRNVVNGFVTEQRFQYFDPLSRTWKVDEERRFQSAGPEHCFVYYVRSVRCCNHVYAYMFRQISIYLMIKKQRWSCKR